ncbi:hypothetical protein GCM10027270_11180 [Nocardioides ginkgobilobae]
MGEPRVPLDQHVEPGRACEACRVTGAVAHDETLASLQEDGAGAGERPSEEAHRRTRRPARVNQSSSPSARICRKV